jgi:hypothetical protein
MSEIEFIQNEIDKLTKVTICLVLCGKQRANAGQEHEIIENQLAEAVTPQTEGHFSLGEVQQYSQLLLDNVTQTATLSQVISDKVRHLDLTSGRVVAAIQLVRDIQLLTTLPNQLAVAMEGKHLTRACEVVSQYLQLNHTQLESLFNGIPPLSTTDSKGSLVDIKHENPIPKIKELQEKLKQDIYARFTQATRDGNADDIQSYFKLFPLIGQDTLGLDIFSDYLNKLTSSTPKTGVTADDLTSLFQFVAKLIDTHTPNVNQLYGVGKMEKVIQKVHAHTDSEAISLIDSFSQTNIKPKLMLSLEKKQASDQALRELDFTLSECQVICQRCLTFESWIHQHSASSLTNQSQLNQRVQELMGHYILLEESFIHQSISKAMRNDVQDGQTTSSVDDSFYILKKSAARFLATDDIETVCAMMNFFGRLLEVDVVDVYRKRVEGETGDEFILLCNNLDVCVDYLGRLCAELEVDVKRLSSFARHQEKVVSCLNGLRDYSVPFRGVTRSCVEMLFARDDRVKTLLQEASRDGKFVLSEDEFAMFDSQGLFVKRLTAGLSQMLEFYEVPKLTYMVR